MKFALLYYVDVSQAPQYTPEERGAATQGWFTLLSEMKAAGVYVENFGFDPAATTQTVRNRNGQAVTAEGPFAADTKTLAGFYMLDCHDSDEAARWAARISNANGGAVEIRPIITYTEDMAKKGA